MKKLIAMLLCLCMVMTSMLAAAEDVAQAVLAQAFQNKVSEFMSRVIPGKSLVYSAVTADGQNIKEKISVLQAADGSEINDITIAMPGLSQPLTVQISKSQQALWLSYEGSVLELRLEDLSAIVQALISAFSAPQMDPQVAQEIAMLFLQDVLMPGIAVEQGENSTTIRVALNAKDVINGLVLFGDQVLSNEKYWTELKPLLQYYAQQQQYRGDFAADFEQNWPQMKEQLLATEIDAQLNASVVIQQPGDGSVMVAGKITFTSQGQSYSLVIGAADDYKQFELSLSVNMSMGFLEATLGKLEISCDKEAGNLAANLSVPAAQLEANLTANLTQNYGTASLQAHIDVFQQRALVFALDAESIQAGDVLTSNAVMTTGNGTVSSSVYWSKYVKTMKINNVGQSLVLDVRNDDIGNFTAKLSLPNYQGDFDLEGNVTANSLRASLTYSNPRMLSSYRAAMSGFTADLTAAWGYGPVTVSLNVNAGRATYAGQIYWTNTDKLFSVQSGDQIITLNVQQDAYGNVTMARLVQSDASYPNGFELVYTPAGVEYHDKEQDVNATWYFASETEFVIDVAVASAGSSQTQHAYVRYTLIDEGDDWRIEGTVMGPDGATAATVTLSCEPAGEIALLSEKDPVRLTPEIVMMLLQQAMAAQQGVTTPAYY